MSFFLSLKSIQARGNQLYSEIHRLINSIWNKEELPQQRKESIVVPTYKKSDKMDCSNYGGISLLPTTYKVLTSVLISRLTPYIEIIGDHQCGFQCNRSRSTTHQIFCIHQILEKKWEYNGAVNQLF
jgi:sorting nexin-29